jgi:hypothetical protein
MADLFSKQPQDFDLYVVETFDEIVYLTLPRHTDAMNAFQELKHPTSGWRRGGVVNLVWHGRVVVC